MKKIMFAILLLMATTTGFSQLLAVKGGTVRPIKISVTPREDLIPKGQYQVVYGRIVDDDTILIVYLPEVDIDLMGRYYELMDTRQGRRLVNNVRKVYPYAKLAGEKMREFDTIMANVNNDSERSAMMEQAEDELSAQFTDELKKLTFSQGLILIRLIDRETGSTSYQVVRELRGRVRAFFYQGFARLWGYNLKTEYDPINNSEDRDIETIITLLENGQI